MTFKQFFLESVDRWQNYLAGSEELRDAVDLLKELEKLGGSAYIVGGAVRDIVLGHSFSDIDIATNVPISKIASRFPTHDIGASKDFGIVTVGWKGHQYELAQYRRDGKYVDGRRPESVEIVMDFQEDSSRRDFTINAMGIDSSGNLIDFFDGQKDIKEKVIRTVGNPLDRFEEDHLRLLRTSRFASKLGFSIDPATKDAMKKLAGSVKSISPERIRDELMKNASYGGKEFAEAISILDEVGILQIILPEVAKLKEFEHSVTSHPESPHVLGHVLAALKASGSKDPIVNLGILLHDIGKAETRAYNDKGIVQYLGHAHEGAKLADEVGRRLRMSNEDREALVFSTLNHMKIHDLLDMSNSKIWNLIKNKNFGILMDVSKADAGARGPLFKKEKIEEIVAKIEQVKEKMTPTQYDELRKLVSGHKIMELLGIKPGPELGKIIDASLEWAIDNSVTDAGEIYDWIKKTYARGNLS